MFFSVVHTQVQKPKCGTISDYKSLYSHISALGWLQCYYTIEMTETEICHKETSTNKLTRTENKSKYLWSWDFSRLAALRPLYSV